MGGRTTGARGLAMPIRWLRDILSAADRSHARRRSAECLAELGDHALADIGLSREDARMLARNPDLLPDHLRRS